MAAFALLQEYLAHYAAPSSGFNATVWKAALTPLTAYLILCGTA
jgi:hypothetical protein